MSVSKEDVLWCYRAILGREPESEEVVAKKIKDHDDFKSLRRSFLESEEFLLSTVSSSTKNSFYIENEYISQETLLINLGFLVNILYSVFLGRDAEEDGLKTHLVALKKNGLASVIKSFIDSNEFQYKYVDTYKNKIELIKFLINKKRNTNHDDSNFFADKIKYYSSLNLRYFGALPNTEEILSLAQNEEPIGLTFAKKIKSEKINPFKNIQNPKILIFGAYGNGNIGDAYQATAVSQILSKAWGIPIECFDACSYLQISSYEFPEVRNVSSDLILDSDQINKYDLLVIGGGGLFAHPHTPLNIKKITQDWNLPIVILGVGASDEIVIECSDLISRAWVVSARDSASLEALRKVRSDTFLIRDPVLISGSLKKIECDQKDINSNLLPKKDKKVLWIVKYPTSIEDEMTINEIVEKTISNPNLNMVVGIEPELDSVLLKKFGSKILLTRDLNQLNNMIDESDIVVSMRYHGSIFACLRGKPSIGTSQRKLYYLYNECNISGEYIDNFLFIDQKINDNTSNSYKSTENNTKVIKHIYNCFFMTINNTMLNIFKNNN